MARPRALRHRLIYAPAPFVWLQELIALATSTDGVSRGTGNKLREAMDYLEKDQLRPACNKLNEFVDGVKAQSAKRIAPAAANGLIEEATQSAPQPFAEAAVPPVPGDLAGCPVRAVLRARFSYASGGMPRSGPYFEPPRWLCSWPGRADIPADEASDREVRAFAARRIAVSRARQRERGGSPPSVPPWTRRRR